MEVSSQLHTPGKEPWYLLDRRLGHTEPIWTGDEEKKHFPTPARN